MTKNTYITTRPFFQEEISSLREKAANYNLLLTSEQEHNPELLAKAIHDHEQEMVLLILRTTTVVLENSGWRA